jgi:hypothetical protein
VGTLGYHSTTTVAPDFIGVANIEIGGIRVAEEAGVVGDGQWIMVFGINPGNGCVETKSA